MKGKKRVFSKEHRRNMRLAAKRRERKPFSKEHIKNIRLAAKKRRTYVFKKCEVCQKKFKVCKSREKIARFCSCKCRAKKIMPKNPHRFSKGHIPWNKWLNKNVNGVIKRMAKNRIGKKNWRWKGDKVGYHGLHCWVRRNKGKPQKCVDCGSEEHVYWSNESGMYLRDLDDWVERCPKCHSKHDRQFKSKARDKFPEIDRRFKTRYKR